MANNDGKKRRRSGRRRSTKEGRYLVIAVVATCFILGLITVFLLGKYREQRLENARLEQAEKLSQMEPPPAPPASAEPLQVAPTTGPGTAGAVAIVIDDMGGSMAQIQEIVSMDAPISIAVLPFLAHSEEVAVAANEKGLEVLLHVPMEPDDMKNNDPGKGLIHSKMSTDEVKKRLYEDMMAVPHIVGMNNHMGSRLTEDERLMRAVLETARDKGLYFLDSRTTNGSVVKRVAASVGARSAGRHVFLDNERDRDYIKRQIKELVNIARKRGSAIAIGHPYPETLEVLRDEVPGLLKDGVRIVKVSELVE